MPRLQNRVAIVTGGTSGIGEAIAARFVAEGGRVVVAGRDGERGSQAATRIGAHFVRCDVTREHDLATLVEETLHRFGGLDCFVGNAGDAGAHGSIVDIDEAGFDQTVGTLFKGVALGIKYACRAMRVGGGGSIITISSGAALLGGLAPHIYTACKAAVIGLTRSVAFEQGAHQIRVNCICAGGIQTPIFAKTLGVYGNEELTQRLNQAVGSTVSAATALGRIGMPSEIAAVAAWLASGDAAYVTGQAIVADGGETIGKVLDHVPKDSPRPSPAD